MRRIRFIICCGILIAMVPLMVRTRDNLPVRTHELIGEKYGGWSGVIRIWVFEGWQAGTGSISPWLNRCMDFFEKKHEGVYLQAQYVNESAMAGLGENGVIPPDMIIYPPGLFESPGHLLPMDASPLIRAPLKHTGDYRGMTYAQPILAGGYAWAINESYGDSISSIWANGDAPVSVLPDEPYRNWGAGLLSLSALGYDKEEAYPGEVPSGEIDIGLEAAAIASRGEISRDFEISEAAWRNFANGDIAAMPVTQREIRRLSNLSDQGKGPDWRIEITGTPFTDQILFASIIDRDTPAGQKSICFEFADFLLSDGCQGALSGCGAFSVTGCLSGYPGHDPMLIMETYLRREALIAPGSFLKTQADGMDSIVRKFISGKTEYGQLIDNLQNAF